jgi:hypothetical protein
VTGKTRKTTGTPRVRLSLYPEIAAAGAATTPAGTSMTPADHLSNNNLPLDRTGHALVQDTHTQDEWAKPHPHPAYVRPRRLEPHSRSDPCSRKLQTIRETYLERAACVSFRPGRPQVRMNLCAGFPRMVLNRVGECHHGDKEWEGGRSADF